MDYKKHYELLIAKARSQKKIKFETNHHHIVPTCVGGADSLENKVHLSLRQHSLAHKLLHKIYPDNLDLARAVTIAGKKGDIKISSRMYERIMKMVSSDEKLRERGRKTIALAREALRNNPEAVEKHRKIVSEIGKRVGATVGVANLAGYWDGKSSGLSANGSKGAKKLNSITARCAVCGLKSTLPGIHTHQRYNDHEGVIRETA